MAQFIEGTVVFQQFLIHCARCSDFIRETPHGDAGMIIILNNQFLHLRKGVGPPVCHVHGDIRDLGPNNDAVFIAQIVELLSMLIVGKTQGVSPQLPDNCYVCLMLLKAQRITGTLPVLMTAAAPQGLAASVEDEALLWVDFKLTASKAGADLISAVQCSGSGVKIGIVHAVPEVDILNGEY